MVAPVSASSRSKHELRALASQAGEVRTHALARGIARQIGKVTVLLPLTRSHRSPPGGVEASEIDIRQMCTLRDRFKHRIVARQQAARASAAN
jgi:hypothetical protein